MAMMISRKARIVALCLLIGVGAIPLACTSTGEFRDKEGGCEQGFRLVAGEDMEGAILSGKHKEVECRTTTYHLPFKNRQPGDAAEFTYSFLELSEGDPAALKNQAQWEKLEKVLKGERQKYVIVFIHGWRNDASTRAADDHRFRTLLTYSRQFLNHRCRGTERRYCGAQLIGVFIGWRGSVIKEIGDTNLALPASLWTFWNRKKKSEQHAEGIVRHIKTIEGRLDLNPGDPTADKMLIIGHSFGGNMLATALHECLTGKGNPKVFCGDGALKIEKIADYKQKELAAAPLGDLTVIVNPAAELKKWSDIQRAVRKRNGYEDDPESNQWQVDRLFPRYQRPTYIALTAAQEWSDEEVCKDAAGKTKCDENYDWATGTLFRIGQFYRRDLEERAAIGHILPTAQHPFGASHEVVTNASDAPDTDIEQGLDPDNALCAVQDGWLWQVRGHAKAATGYWDTQNRVFVRKAHAGTSSIIQQFRLGLSPAGAPAGSRNAFEPANTPFWSVRAAPNAISDHNSYINYPLWCSLNQMVLDDITRH